MSVFTNIHMVERRDNKVQPPMEEDEIITYFIHAINLEQLDHTFMMARKTFAEIFKTGDMVEDRLKTERIINLTELQTTHKAFQTSSFRIRKKKEKKIMVVITQGSISHYK